MSQAFDLDRPPVILHQQGGAVVLAIAALAFAGIGFWVAASGAYGVRGVIAGVLGGVVFGWFAVLGFAAQLRPYVLIIEPAGLVLGGPLWNRHWAWSDIVDVNLVTVRGAGGVGMTTRSPNALRSLLYRVLKLPGNDGLPTCFEIEPAELVLLLKQAKARWD